MSDGLSHDDATLEAPGGQPLGSAGGACTEHSGHQSAEDRTAGAPLVMNGERFRSRWASIQVGFVDDPRRAVGEAEQLVTDVIDELVEGFRRQREHLENSGEGSTDEMRTAFQRYRDFFQRLLNV